jgi:NADH-quinone oxidoreductase subunit J|tara:strand:- start:243 stop:1016 length:774 start_codon:yes stop_codon:yes gene_type:complete
MNLIYSFINIQSFSQNTSPSAIFSFFTAAAEAPKILVYNTVLSFPDIVLLFFIGTVLVLALYIILSKDIINCLLSLILLYVVAAMFLLSYNLQFLAFALIAVSLGAVCVLFLYVVLMVNMKGSRVSESIFYKSNISCFLISTFSIAFTLMYTQNNIQARYDIAWATDKVDPLEVVDEVLCPQNVDFIFLALHETSPLQLYGIVLYDHYFLLFVLIGVLLLAALIGCLVISYDSPESTFSNRDSIRKNLTSYTKLKEK